MRRQACIYCFAKGGKKHAGGCNRPQGQLKRKFKAIPAIAAFFPSPRNRIAILIDRSGSMNGLRFDVPRIITEQVAEIKKNAAKMGQPTSLTFYEFNDSVMQTAHYEDVFDYKGYGVYYPNGNTAMFDAVGMAIQNFQRSGAILESNTSFLVITITDGEENRSRSFTQTSIASLIKSVERTDKWTFVFSVPRGGRKTVSSFGIPDGNIQEWEQTTAGINSMTQTTNSGMSTYYAARSQGIMRSVNFFQPDMSAVSKTAIRNLKDLSRDFHVWTVDMALPIREFVERQLANQPSLARRIGGQYQIGRGYYQLIKTEEVQASKDIIILDMSTNALYGGIQARELIGCPMNISFKIKPDIYSDYEIFIKSTSVNRKLLPGMKVLYNIA